jgi:hypothetical protein
VTFRELTFAYLYLLFGATLWTFLFVVFLYRALGGVWIP